MRAESDTFRGSRKQFSYTKIARPPSKPGSSRAEMAKNPGKPTQMGAARAVIAPKSGETGSNFSDKKVFIDANANGARRCACPFDILVFGDALK
jgi:hypothetical protein